MKRLVHRARRLLGRWPFTILGLLTYGLLIVVAAGGRPEGLVGLFRVLIIPLYIMRVLTVALLGDVLARPAIGPWIDWMTVPLLFLPYVIVDLLWHRTPGRSVAARSP